MFRTETVRIQRKVLLVPRNVELQTRRKTKSTATHQRRPRLKDRGLLGLRKLQRGVARGTACGSARHLRVLDATSIRLERKPSVRKHAKRRNQGNCEKNHEGNHKEAVKETEGKEHKNTGKPKRISQEHQKVTKHYTNCTRKPEQHQPAGFFWIQTPRKSYGLGSWGPAQSCIQMEVRFVEPPRK